MLLSIHDFLTKLNITLLIFVLSKATSLMDIPSDEKPNVLILEQLKSLDRCFENNAEVLIVHHNINYSHNILQFYKEQVTKRPTLLMDSTHLYRISGIKYSRTKYIFIFIQKIMDLRFVVKYDTRNMWAPLKYVIVLGKSININERKRLKDIIENTLWSAKIINFLIIFYEYGLNVISYNPFSHEVMNFSDLDSCNLYPDKIKNMHKYEIKVSMFPDPPQVESRENNKLAGADVTLLELIAERMNFTINFVAPESLSEFSTVTDSHIEVISGKTDFCFVNLFAVSSVRNAQYTYPNGMNNVVVLMTKKNKNNKIFNLFRAFDEFCWIGLGASILAIALCQYFRTKALNIIRRSFHDSVLYTWTVLHGAPLTARTQNMMPTKFLLIMWLMCAMLVNFAFQCSMTSMFIHPPKAQYIDTLDELSSNNIAINIRPVIKNQLLKTDFFNFVEVNNSFRYLPFRGVNNHTGVAVLENIAEIFMQQNNQLRAVKEYLIPSQSAYYFPLNSPYILRINQIMMMNNEFGITKYMENIKQFSAKQITVKKKKFIPLEIEQLMQAFLLLIIGVIISVLVFFSEILYFNKFGK